MTKNIRNMVLVLALMSVTSLVSFRVGEYKVQQGVAQNGQLDLSMMWKVKADLSKMFLEKDKMVDKDMAYGAIQGMVASLGDPYTMYLPPKQNQASNQDLAGAFGGVGIELGYKDSQLAVMAPLAKTPAEKAGVLAGDLILKITDKANNVDKDTTGISLTEAVDLIRGKIGTEVTLKLYRESKKDTFDVTMKRDNIVVASSELVWVDSAKASTTEKSLIGSKKIAWVRLYKFSDQIYKEWPMMVDNILSEKAKPGNNYGGIVLDLRNNPGGFLQASVLVASDFIDHGTIVTQASADG
ncbi:MAG: S41 family peptidase, partial [Candidatus Shapirobacteria bacterium]|nr:S41 family peptidase [Candidatus Shapirobacteria bacterium]